MAFLTSKLGDILLEEARNCALSDLIRFIGGPLPLPFPDGSAPGTWWRAVNALGSFSAHLCELASLLLESTATTGAIERAFSTAKWIDSRQGWLESNDRIELNRIE